MMPAVPARVDLATPAEPDQGSAARARLKAAALGVVGALLVPLPAAAAPAACQKPLRYAAQSGTQLMRIAGLELSPAGHGDEPIKDVGLGEVKSALVAQSPINAAALGRMLDGGPAALTEVVRQTAPPNLKKPGQRKYEAAQAGPYRLGRSEQTVEARWDPRMGCGTIAGEATRAEAGVRRAGVLVDGDGSLVGVPGKISGLSTTAMERPGPGARAVAAASMGGSKIELLGGAVEVKIVRPPSLLASMSGTDGGEVRYEPAELEVSGDGFETARLTTAGDNFALHLDEDGNPRQDGVGEDTGVGAENGAKVDNGPVAEGGTGGGGAITDKPGTPGGDPDKKDPGRRHGKSGLVGEPGSAGPLPLPSIPAVPPMAPRPDPEVAPAAGPGTTVRISLGDVRQAVFGHAIAAKATAIKVAIAKGPNPQRADHRGGVVLNLDVGLLEAAAVAPEPVGGTADTLSTVGGEGGEGGGGGGLPITGARVDLVALTGLALLIGGAAALVFGLRGRYRP